MPKKKVEAEQAQFSPKVFLDAIDEFVKAKGIKKEKVIEILKDSLETGYRKQLGQKDAYVRCDIDGERGTIDLYFIRIVVKDVQDDFLEIDIDEANELDPSKKYNLGDEFLEKASLEDLKKACVVAAKSVISQKISEAEKELLYELYKDKKGQMIYGHVETDDDRGLSISIAGNAAEKTLLYLPRKELIPGETFKTGDRIRLYVSDVTNDGKKGTRINISRANVGFLKQLFQEEIREIADGTVIIKDIVRKAGERSKVSVYSLDPNVEPAGTCIGPAGTRIQRVVAQLGNGKNKERIDVISYSDNPSLYIMEALKPANVLGINYDADSGKAIVVVTDDTLTKAVGIRGVNISLARQLTKHDITIKSESDAKAEGISYQTYQEVEALAKNSRFARIEIKKSIEGNDPTVGKLPEGYIAPNMRKYEDPGVSLSDEDREIIESGIDDEELNASIQEEIDISSDEVKEVAPKKEDKIEVKTTTTLESLEKQLEEEAKKKDASKRTTTKKKEEKKEEEKPVEVKPVQPAMAIYTEEELRQIEEEEAKQNEAVSDEEEEDYDEYDDYYDDK